MVDNFEICINCRNGHCDMCDDMWEDNNGEEHYCVCDCNREDFEDENSDIWNRYRSEVDEYYGDYYYND
jgi:hypothetical protein